MVERMGAILGKGVFIDDVIDNIELDGDYYKKKTINVSIGENHELFKIFQEN